MRTSTLLSILPFLAYTSARVIQRTRDHKEIMNNLSARGDYFAPEHDQDETLVKIINEPGSDAAQYLSYDGNSFTAFSTSTHGASALPTGFNFANKNLAQGDSPSKSQIDQVGAASYEADQPPEIDPAIAGGQGTVPQEEVDEWLRVHNIARGAHGAGPLEWSEELAKSAKSNAEQCKGEHTSVVLCLSVSMLMVKERKRVKISLRIVKRCRHRLLWISGWVMLVRVLS
jgi:hypothetical protein